MSTDGSPKAALRRAAERARLDLGPEQRHEGDLARSALLAPLLAGARVAAYLPFGTEPVPPLDDDVLVPVLLPDRDLDWRRLGGGPLLGVDALAGCDVVLVPALAVDRRGTRLGRGGGSYDRALPRATGRLVALLHEGELAQLLPAEEHDVPVQAVALPSGLFSCSATMSG